MSRHWVGTLEDIRCADPFIVDVGGIEIGIFHVDDQCYAYRNICPHNAAPICKGIVCGTTMPSDVYMYEYGCDLEIIRCPWHGWEFHLKTGKHLTDPKIKLKSYVVEIENGNVYVEL